MKHLQLLTLLFLPFLISAQTVKGFIYDDDSKVKGAKIINRTQNILAYSDDEGQFQIEAKINDVLVINSYFHEQEFVNITSESFEKDIAIVLKKVTNTLDEVEVNDVRDKLFDSINFTNTTAKQGQIAYKKRTFGSGENYQPTLDLIAVAKLIGNLFKNKNKKPDVVYVAAEDMETLFETNTYFNQNYLQSQLEIPKPYQQLFFDYCSAQQCF